MSVTRVSIGVVGFVLAVTTTLVVAAVWLLVTDPVTVADAVTDAVTEGEISPLVKALATILMDAVIGLFRYL